MLTGRIYGHFGFPDLNNNIKDCKYRILVNFKGNISKTQLSIGYFGDSAVDLQE